MKIRILVTFILFALLSCKPQMDYVWKKDGFNGKKMNKVAVIVVSKDNAARQAIENRIVEDLKGNGIDAISGLSFLPPNATKSDWETENIAKKLISLEVDGAISVTLINTSDKTEYIPRQTYMYPVGYYRYGWNVYNTYDSVYSPGYYEQQTEYLVESKLYDVKVTSDEERALLWIGQSSLTSPSSLNDAARTFGDNLIGYLIENKVITK
jgi:hypothetical protein